jgi:hypothetical protein
MNHNETQTDEDLNKASQDFINMWAPANKDGPFAFLRDRPELEFNPTQVERETMYRAIETLFHGDNCRHLYRRLMAMLSVFRYVSTNQEARANIDAVIHDWKREFSFIPGIETLDTSYEVSVSGIGGGYVIRLTSDLMNLGHGIYKLKYFALTPQPDDGSEPYYPYLMAQMQYIYKHVTLPSRAIIVQEKVVEKPKFTYWVEIKESQLKNDIYILHTEKVGDTLRFGFNDKSEAIDLFNLFRKNKLTVSKNWID